MMKYFTSPRLRLLGPASNAWPSSIMLKSVITYVYNAQIALKPAPMAPECQKKSCVVSFCLKFVQKLT